MTTRPDNTNWTEALPSMDVEAMPVVFPELTGFETDAARNFGEDRKHVRRTDKQVLLDARRLKNALQHVGRLPRPREAFHLVTKGSYSLWHVIRAILTLGAPATIRTLRIATLGFSKANLDDLLKLLDSGQIGEITFLYSVYFRSGQREDCERLTHELGRRGHKVLAMLQHAKVLCVALTDGRQYVVESSANLRSCASLEQIMLVADKGLFEFHSAWIDSLFTTEAAK